VSAANVKPYEAEGFYFEFSPNGTPYIGTLRATDEAQSGPYEAEVNLQKAGSRERYAKKAAELYGMDGSGLERALNEVCTRRSEEVAAAVQAERGEEQEPESAGAPEEAEALLDSPGVLNRYVEDVAKIRGVIRDRDALRLQTLVALGVQLAPLPNGKPAGAILILTAEAGRGKNYVCDAVASMLPDAFYMAFESASAKSLYYKAETDPRVLSHRWIYPNEAEATDQLVELFRPLLSGGRASHLTKLAAICCEATPRGSPLESRHFSEPQGGRAAYQGDPGAHARAGYDRQRELPRPSHAPLHGARHDRSCIPRGPAPEGSLTSRRDTPPRTR
jgi:hypothetical protein